jgi:outer membrane receptor protein involved in Fe transport
MFIRRLLSIVALLPVSFAVAESQAPTAPGLRTAPSGEIRGRVVGPNGQPIPTASITVRSGKDTSFAGGTLPRADGSFVADGLTPGAYAVRIRAIGHAPVMRTGIMVTPQAPADLGTVTLQPAVVNLAEQVVTAERDNVTLSPERNSYSVKGMASAAGGNAVDALRNVPSVEVDMASNAVSLRGNSNVVVQINGRTSPLRGEQLGTFLTQIPAATLTRIEVTTSPSAKEDPEGTAGIINIVLAQEVESSRTAGFSLGTGTTGLANGSANAGIQRGRWTLFSSASGSSDPRSLTGLSSRTNTAPVTSFSNSDLAGESDPMSGSFISRSEYKATKTWAISFDAIATRARQGRNNLSRFTILDANEDTTGQFDDYTTVSSRNTMQDYNMAFRRQGPKVNPFSIESRYTRMDMSSGNLRVLEPFDGSTTPTLIDSLAVRFPTMTLQSDYSRPLGRGAKVDVGVKSTRRELSSATQNLRMDGDVASTLRSGSIDYQETINAAYGMGARQFGKAQVQIGARIEHTDTRLDVASRPAPITADYLSVFPNGAINYALDKSTQLRASYSRRIFRPQAGQLDPAERYETAQAVFRGNPDLMPEYTDAYEFGFQQTTGWGSLQFNPYVRQTDDAMRQIRTVDDNGVTITTFANAASMRTIGADVNANVRRGKLSVTMGGGMFDYRSEAGEFSTQTMSGRAQMNATFAASSRWDGQVQANYMAAQGVEGGTRLANFMTQVSGRWKIRGDAANVLTLRLADPFNTQRMRVRTRTGAVTEDLERRVGMRGLFLTYSRTFGQQLKLRPQQEADPSSQLGGPPPL